MIGLGAMDAPMALRILDGVWINAIEVFDGKALTILQESNQ